MIIVSYIYICIYICIWLIVKSSNKMMAFPLPCRFDCRIVNKLLFNSLSFSKFSFTTSNIFRSHLPTVSSVHIPSRPPQQRPLSVWAVPASPRPSAGGCPGRSCVRPRPRSPGPAPRPASKSPKKSQETHGKCCLVT